MAITAEEVYDRIPFFGEDDVKRLITKVILRLPEEVATYVFSRCVFTLFRGPDHGLCFPGRWFHPEESDIADLVEELSGDSFAELTDRVRDRMGRIQKWVIILSDDVLTMEDGDSIVAHEIAHAWLGHDTLSSVAIKDFESEACEQTREWGFGGRGADENYGK